MLKYNLYNDVKKAVESVYKGNLMRVEELYTDDANHTYTLTVTARQKINLEEVPDAISNMGCEITNIDLREGRLSLKFKLKDSWDDVCNTNSGTVAPLTESEPYNPDSVKFLRESDIEDNADLGGTPSKEDHVAVFNKLYDTVESVIINGLYEDGRQSDMVNFHTYLASLNEKHLCTTSDTDSEKTHIGYNIIDKYVSGKIPTPSQRRGIMRNTYSYEIFKKISEMLTDDMCSVREFLCTYHKSRARMEKL